MDAWINARYYRVSDKPNFARQNFCELLEHGYQSPPLERERDLGQGVVVRLERFQRLGRFTYGEFSRVQTVNIPPQTTPDGLEPIELADGRGLAHVCAFQYHEPTRVILLQRNPLGATPSRVGLYLKAISPGTLFSLSPVLRSDALPRLMAGNAKSLKISFAAPTDLSAIEDGDAAGLDNIERLGEMFKSPEIEIRFTVGRARNTFLDNAMVRRVVGALRQSSADIKTLEVSVENDFGVDPIDFLGDALKVHEQAELPSNNPDAKYRTISSILASSFEENFDYISQIYGSTAEG